MRASRNKNWKLCPTCKLIVFTEDLVKHQCPSKVRAKIDADLDMAVDAEMVTWDRDVRNFWNSKDVGFMQWELENE